MKESNSEKQNNKKSKHRLFKPRKKKTVEEDAAIQYLQSQYDKILPEEIKTLKDLPLSQKTLKGLKENNFIVPTDIQRLAIGYALQGKDILGAAKTGSGKTLAFLIPILELLFCKKWTRHDGVGAVVISPTRELAYQIYATLRKVGHYHDFSAGLIIGGQNLKFEKKRMDQINILICTPGRLLQHMDENPLFDCSRLQILVLDEADRCLDMGFETTMNAIIENLPSERQTLLFSATQTKSVKDLARLSLSFPTYVAPHEHADSVTPESLQQSFIVCNSGEKLGILWSFIRNHLKQKVLVFMATCKQVKYTYELFCKLRPGVSLLALYGTLHQEKRERIYEEFCRKSNVVLFATDLASRGLDFPKVNWVIQYDCPENVATYIHRAGRTARGVLGKGEGLLVLLPSEEKIVEELWKSKIPINKISVDPSKVMFPQRKIESLLSESIDFKQTAQRAFVSYLKSIYLMKNKDIFNVQSLDTDAYAKSLGLIAPPRIRFLENIEKNKARSRKQNEAEDTGAIEKLETASPNGTPDTSIIQDKTDQDITNINNNKAHNDNFTFYNDADSDVDSAVQIIKDVKSSDQMKTKKFTQNKSEGVYLNFDGGIKGLNSDFAEFAELASFFLTETVVDLENAKEVLQEQDKSDRIRFREKIKAKHKEQKRKLKNKNKDEDAVKDEFGTESDSDGPDLSWLPDPDNVYNKENETDSSIAWQSGDDASMSGESEEGKYHRPTKRKFDDSKDLVQENLKPRKFKRIEEVSAALSVSEAELLAMQLLKAKN